MRPFTVKELTQYQNSLRELNLSLKIMVDKKAKKVVFAEAGKNFVDFIFQILTLPLATVVKLLKDKGMGGCLGSVYKSVDYLNSQYFEPNVDKESVLKPKVALIVPLLSVNDTPARTKLFKCPSHNRVSFQRGLDCENGACYRSLTDEGFNYVNATSTSERPGFVKGSVTYMVMDDLEVRPMSISIIKEHVIDFTDVEEKVVAFGVKEALLMLKASLETNAVLTTIFLGNDN